MAVRYHMTSSSSPWILTLILFTIHNCSSITPLWIRTDSNVSMNSPSDNKISAKADSINIATMLQCNLTCRERFRAHLYSTSVANETPSSVAMGMTAISLPVIANVSENLAYVCDVISERNITLMVAVGSQDIVNLQYIVSRSSFVPLVAYSTDEEKNTFKVSS